VQKVTYSEDQQLLEKIKEDNDKGILELYRLYRDNFVHWAQQNYKIEEESAADVFQDTVISLHNNIVKGKLFELTSSLKTYLYVIGKNIIRKKLNKMEVSFEQEEEQIANTITVEIIDKVVLNKRQQLVSSLMNNMDEPCQIVLRLFYFKKISVPSITQQMANKNENEAIKQKFRCITILKKMVRDRYNSEDFYTAS
jgi:RNA polymerase sigma-70 factor (ECF subfamily)